MLDYLIVGQGLAGSLLAWELIQRGQTLMVLDNGSINASKVAGGMINPITGQRLVKSQRVDELLPAAVERYRILSDFFNEPFFIEKPMLRILTSAPQRQIALRRLQDPDYVAYLSEPSDVPTNLNAPHGILLQRRCGYLRIAPLLARIRDFLRGRNAYRLAEFNHRELQRSDGLHWRDLTARQIIFCEGHQLRENPWFAYLPLQAAKGEILSGHCESGLPTAMLNYGHWLIADDAGGFKTGASFDPNRLDHLPSRQARQELLQTLQAVCPATRHARIDAHLVGIRPATRDKQPFIGRHPQHANLQVFNGFGAKGSLAIPFYSQRFADHLLSRLALPAECDIRRFNDAHQAG